VADLTDRAGNQAAGTDAFQQTLKVAFELHNAGRETEAEALCRVLLRQNDRDGQLLFLLGMVLSKLGRNGEALKHLEPAAALEPQSGRIFNGLGLVQQGLKNHAAAVEAYVRAIELGQRGADTYYSLGNAYYQLGEVERAAASFQAAVELKPQDVASWNNLGKCLGDLGRMEESIGAYDRAMAVEPDYFLARYGRAISLLTAGRLTEGFREYNQWRHHRLKKREFPQPAWQGEAIPGKTLFLYAEQGFGDAIQYVRFLKQVRERVGKVILECRPELKTLFQHSFGAEVVIAYGEEIPAFIILHRWRVCREFWR
jgi:tetratricopeptide (TPR) repeat protein